MKKYISMLIRISSISLLCWVFIHGLSYDSSYIDYAPRRFRSVCTIIYSLIPSLGQQVIDWSSKIILFIHVVIYITICSSIIIGYARHGGGTLFLLFIVLLHIISTYHVGNVSYSHININRIHNNPNSSNIDVVILDTNITSNTNNSLNNSSNNNNNHTSEANKTITTYDTIYNAGTQVHDMIWNIFSKTDDKEKVKDTSKTQPVVKANNMINETTTELYIRVCMIWIGVSSQSYTFILFHILLCILVSIAASYYWPIFLRSTWIMTLLISSFCIYCCLYHYSVVTNQVIFTLCILVLIAYMMKNREVQVDWITRSCTHESTTWPRHATMRAEFGPALS